MNSMKHILVIFCTLLILSFSTGLEAKSKKRKVDSLKFPVLNKIHKPEIRKAETGNGIKLRLIKSDKLPLVSINIIVKGGDVYDPSDKVGLSQLTASLLKIGGTKNLKPADIDKILDAKGINIMIFSTNSYYAIRLSCLKENLDETLKLIADMLQNPAFDKEKLDELKTKNASGISRRNDQPSGINRREFQTLIYGKSSPFASVMEYEHLDNITVNDIAKTYKAFFAPANMLAGATGPIEIDALKKMFEKHFGAWKHSATLPAYPKATEQKHKFKVAFANKASASQSYFSIGHMGGTRDPKEYAKQVVFNSIFSQGFTCRLMTRVRTKMGLTYGIGGGIYPNRLYPGKTFFTSYTKCETTIKAIDAVLEEIDLIRKEDVTADELERAKDSYLNSYVFKFKDADSILYRAMIREFFGEPQDSAEKLAEDVKKVTVQDIRKVAETYLNPDKFVIFIVGNKDKIEGDLSKLGKVYDMDITIKPPKVELPEATPETLAKGKKLMETIFNGPYKGYKKVKNLRLTGTYIVTAQGGMQVEVVRTTQYPDKIHMEMAMMGMKMKQVIVGNKGAMIHPQGRQDLPTNTLTQQHFQDIRNMMHDKSGA
ncbi:MAG: insulinase family protein, partial [bacterium]|nr:insulinase family protein [bacterium]